MPERRLVELSPKSSKQPLEAITKIINSSKDVARGVGSFNHNPDGSTIILF